MTEVQLCRCETWVLIGIQNVLNFGTSVKICCCKEGWDKHEGLAGKDNIPYWRILDIGG